MATFWKIVAGFFFLTFFLLLLIVGTVRFAILNRSFVFSSFQKHDIYEALPSGFARALPNDPNIPEEEKIVYAQIISRVSPQQMKSIIETNLATIFSFVDGTSQNLSIVVPASSLGLPGVRSISWSLSEHGGLDREGILQQFYGIANKLLFIWLLLFLVVGLFYLKLKRTIFFIAGMVTLSLAVAGKIFLLIIVSNTSMREPSQILLVMLAKSLLTDIASIWIGVGIVCLIIWFALGQQKKKTKKFSGK